MYLLTPNLYFAGTLAGVMLITAMAWFGGRESAKRSMKNGRAGSVWSVPRPRSAKFFSRGSRRRTVEFSPVTPNTPAWESTAYEGASPDTEVQQHFAQQGWQMVKKEPFVALDEAVTPSPTYISNGVDYGMPTRAAGEMETVRHDAGSQPGGHEGVSAGQAEGLGLLHGGSGRPVVKRKEISRKAAPGHRNGMGSL